MSKVSPDNLSPPISWGTSASDTDHTTADVLVIGGGPAGAWAAWSAASEGASVVLADKGYLGSSGAAAAGGLGVLSIPPDPRRRAAAASARVQASGCLADEHWIVRMIGQTYTNLNRLAAWGYPFDPEVDDPDQRDLLGPPYMRLMRSQVKRAGVRVLDQSPALELLVDGSGVGGAAGICRLSGRSWHVRAAAVVIATGGCAFLSKALGCNVLTGDGGLMAAEVGVEMSGMEFSNTYSLSASFASVTKNAHFRWGTFQREDGSIIEGTATRQGRVAIGQALLTQRVLCRLDQAPMEQRPLMRRAQPNFFLPFDRSGIDPFADWFPVTLRLEGTVRGTGGIRILDQTCATSSPGLYAAGDAATREWITGAISGGGSHNGAWCIASGHWAGRSAAAYARDLGPRATARRLHGAGQAGIRPDGPSGESEDPDETVRRVQAEVFPYDRNLFRNGPELTASLGRLGVLWPIAESTAAGTVRGLVRAREAAAMVATARWMYASALARTESRGMHTRRDWPTLDPSQQHRLLSGGLQDVWVRPDLPQSPQKERLL